MNYTDEELQALDFCTQSLTVNKLASDLRAARTALANAREMLEGFQWSVEASESEEIEPLYCLLCYGEKPNHAPDCRLAAALKKGKEASDDKPEGAPADSAERMDS